MFVHMGRQPPYKTLRYVLDDLSVIHLDIEHGVTGPSVVLPKDGPLAVVPTIPIIGVEDAVPHAHGLFSRHGYILGTLRIYNLGFKTPDIENGGN